MRTGCLRLTPTPPAPHRGESHRCQSSDWPLQSEGKSGPGTQARGQERKAPGSPARIACAGKEGGHERCRADVERRRAAGSRSPEHPRAAQRVHQGVPAPGRLGLATVQAGVPGAASRSACLYTARRARRGAPPLRAAPTRTATARAGVPGTASWSVCRAAWCARLGAARRTLPTRTRHRTSRCAWGGVPEHLPLHGAERTTRSASATSCAD